MAVLSTKSCLDLRNRHPLISPGHDTYAPLHSLPLLLFHSLYVCLEYLGDCDSRCHGDSPCSLHHYDLKFLVQILGDFWLSIFPMQCEFVLNGERKLKLRVLSYLTLVITSVECIVGLSISLFPGMKLYNSVCCWVFFCDHSICWIWI